MQRTWSNRTKRIVFISISLFVCALLVLIDQLTKIYFRVKFSKEGVTTVIDNFFYFTYTVNRGSAFSFLANKSWAQTFFKILTPISLLLFVFIYIYSIKHNKGFLSYSTVLIFSGAVGNYIDRLMFNGVTDFVSLQFGSYNFPVFNFADMCLTVGVFMFVIYFLFLDNNAIFKKHDKK